MLSLNKYKKIKVDGVWGKQTTASIKKIQQTKNAKDNKIVATGVLDTQTWDFIRNVVDAGDVN